MKCAIGSSTRETIRTSPTFRRERLSTIDAAKLGSSALAPCAENRFADEQFVPRRGACGAPCPEHVSAVWLTCWLAAPIPGSSKRGRQASVRCSPMRPVHQKWYCCSPLGEGGKDPSILGCAAFLILRSYPRTVESVAIYSNFRGGQHHVLVYKFSHCR
jgi:hypothetical protein